MNKIIYGLYNPVTNVPVYVGKTSVGIDRPFTHIEEKSHSLKVNEWVKSLRLIGKEPVVVILENNCDKEDLLKIKEKFWVNYFIKEGYLLLNSQLVNLTILEDIEFNKIELEDPLYEIRTYIKARRKLLKLTQQELSKKAGIGLRVIRELEQGTKTNFNTDIIIKLLSMLGSVKLSLKM